MSLEEPACSKTFRMRLTAVRVDAKKETVDEFMEFVYSASTVSLLASTQTAVSFKASIMKEK